MISEKKREENRMIAMEYFINVCQLEDFQAAGIVGNFMQESGMDPFSPPYEDDHGFGLARWTSHDRQRALTAYASKLGKGITDLETQLKFCWREFNGTERHALIRLLNTKDIAEAALCVSDYYERPGIPMNEKRITYAKQALKEWHDHHRPKPSLLTTEHKAPPNLGELVKKLGKKEEEDGELPIWDLPTA